MSFCNFCFNITDTRDNAKAARPLRARIVITVKIFSNVVRCDHQLGFLERNINLQELCHLATTIRISG